MTYCQKWAAIAYTNSGDSQLAWATLWTFIMFTGGNFVTGPFQRVSCKRYFPRYTRANLNTLTKGYMIIKYQLSEISCPSITWECRILLYNRSSIHNVIYNLQKASEHLLSDLLCWQCMSLNPTTCVDMDINWSFAIKYRQNTRQIGYQDIDESMMGNDDDGILVFIDSLQYIYIIWI